MAEAGTHDVSVKELEPLRGACLRWEGAPTPEAAGLLWGRLLARGDVPAGPEPPFGLLYKDRYEACRPIPPGDAPPEGLEETEAPGGWYAAALHVGAYDTIGGTVRRLVEAWLPLSGFRRREGPILERYLIDSREAVEEELRTEVCLPVTPDPAE